MTWKVKVKMMKKSVSLLLIVILLSFLCISVIADNDTFKQTVRVTQTLQYSPSRSAYTYRLKPARSTNPMPEGSRDGEYKFSMNGNSEQTFQFNFDATVSGDYQYDLTRVEATPNGDTVTPTSHKFGFLVQRDEDGEMIIIPYTCYDNHMEIWKQTDEKGNPVGITLSNTISGTSDTEVTPSPSPPNKGGGSGTNNGSNNNGNNGKGQYTPKTGDDTPLVSLIILAVVSVLMVIFLVWMDRRKERGGES